MFDTTVLWGAFFKPGGPNAKLLDLAAQRSPVLDGFITDAVGAEFWWRATQQGVTGPKQRAPRVYTGEELDPFFEVYGTLFEPEHLHHAALGRSLGRYAGLVGLPLAEALATITGRDRDALLASPALTTSMTFESVDIADLHVLVGALENDADMLCTNDRRTLGYDPVGPLRVHTSVDIAAQLGLIAPTATMPPASARPRPRPSLPGA